MDIKEYATLYHENLINGVVPFWMKNSDDKEYGGYFSCLGRDGKVYDIDKFIWLQCSQVWCFSMLYNKVESKQQWLDFALQGANFLIKNGRDQRGNWYFSLARDGDQQLIRKAVDVSLRLLEYGWDQQYGGIFYFLDVKGYPPQQLEWDQKLWWVHLEAIISMLKGYLLTGNERFWQWFETLHAYCFDRFVDEEYGEWFGYLNRRGELLFDLKGGKWKGCFHVPRALYQIWETLEKMLKNQEQFY